ncbi:hypothetical protein MASR2M78_33800 [Treponema sp.]
MKRIFVIVAASLIAAASLSAQAWGSAAPGAAFQAAETVKVEGKLALVNGMIAVQSKDKTYYVGGLNRLVGFVDGLKEGSNVKLEGAAIALPMAPEYMHLRVTKLSFNGKDYDLSQANGRGMMGGRGAQDFGGRGSMGGRPNNGPQGNMGRRR